jgi:hypothetical protein
VTQEDSWDSLSLIAMTSPGVGACFILVGTSERLPTWTTGDVWFGTIRESSMEKRVACELDFPLQGVYRFESPRLSDMSTACLWQSSRR